MATDQIDPKTLKLLGNLMALVISGGDGEARQSLNRLRQQATRDRITGGAIKEAFESVTSGRTDDETVDPQGPSCAQLQQKIDHLLTEKMFLQAALAQEKHNTQRRERLRRRVLVSLAGVIVVGGVISGGYALWPAADDPSLQAHNYRLIVEPAVFPTGVSGAAWITANPTDTAVLPTDTRDAIAAHFVQCGFLEVHPLQEGDPELRIRANIDAHGKIQTADVSIEPAAKDLTASQFEADQRTAQSFARAIQEKVCATLPLPPYLQGRITTMGIRLTR